MIGGPAIGLTAVALRGYDARNSGPPCRSLTRMVAGVAQLAEQRFRKPQVAGSIPVAGSRLPRSLETQI